MRPPAACKKHLKVTKNVLERENRSNWAYDLIGTSEKRLKWRAPLHLVTGATLAGTIDIPPYFDQQNDRVFMEFWSHF